MRANRTPLVIGNGKHKVEQSDIGAESLEAGKVRPHRHGQGPVSRLDEHTVAPLARDLLVLDQQDAAALLQLLLVIAVDEEGEGRAIGTGSGRSRPPSGSTRKC